MKLEATGRVASATITFNQAELEFLAVIMLKIGGSPLGHRAHATNLGKLLGDIGYDWDHVSKTKIFADARSGDHIHFDDM